MKIKREAAERAKEAYRIVLIDFSLGTIEEFARRIINLYAKVYDTLPRSVNSSDPVVIDQANELLLMRELAEKFSDGEIQVLQHNALPGYRFELKEPNYEKDEWIAWSNLWGYLFLS